MYPLGKCPLAPSEKTFQEIGKYERTRENKKETHSENYLDSVAMRTKMIDLEIKDTREVWAIVRN